MKYVPCGRRSINLVDIKILRNGQHFNSKHISHIMSYVGLILYWSIAADWRLQPSIHCRVKINMIFIYLLFNIIFICFYLLQIRKCSIFG